LPDGVASDDIAAEMTKGLPKVTKKRAPKQSKPVEIGTAA
jgi:hypothetical protein